MKIITSKSKYIAKVAHVFSKLEHTYVLQKCVQYSSPGYPWRNSSLAMCAPDLTGCKLVVVDTKNINKKF